jgi:hypothetical protein
MDEQERTMRPGGEQFVLDCGAARLGFVGQAEDHQVKIDTLLDRNRQSAAVDRSQNSSSSIVPLSHPPRHLIAGSTGTSSTADRRFARQF